VKAHGPLTFPAPARLQAEAQKLRKLAESRTRVTSLDYLRAAADALRTWTPGDPLSWPALRGLVTRYTAESDPPEVLDRIEAILQPNLGRLHLGKILGIWQLGGRHHALTAKAFRDALRTHMAHGERVARFVPAFVTEARTPQVFEDPVPYLGVHIVSRQLALSDLGSSDTDLGVAQDRGVGLAAILHVIRSGPATWWADMDPAALRDWATHRSLVVQQAVADRVLCEIGGNATNPAEVRDPKAPDTLAWLRWCLRWFGEPDEASGKWAGVSERGRQIYRWIILLGEFDKILEEFRSHSSDQDRADFWISYLHALTDARCFRAQDAAVCLMAFGPLVAIEFGQVNNACYLYEWREDRDTLKSIRLSRDYEADDFKTGKDGDFVRLGSNQVRFDLLGRIFHRRADDGRPTWFANARAKLAELGVPARPRTRR
jgi:hypothetical protein